MRSLLFFLGLLSLSSQALVFPNSPLPERLELAPEHYQQIYTFWRKELEVTRTLQEKLELERRSFIELPYLFNFKNETYAFNFEKNYNFFREPPFIEIASPERFSRSSLRWLGMISSLAGLNILLAPNESLNPYQQLLANQLAAKENSLEDFLAFSEGMDDVSMGYIYSTLNHYKQHEEDVHSSIKREIEHLQSMVKVIAANMKAQLLGQPYLDYNPHYVKKLARAELWMSKKVYTTYEEMRPDQEYVDAVRKALYDDYTKRSESYNRYSAELSRRQSKLNEMQAKYDLAQKALNNTLDQIKNAPAMIAAKKEELTKLYISWGHLGDPFKRYSDEQRQFEERKLVDMAFSNIDSSFNYWKNRALLVKELHASIQDFEKLCALQDSKRNPSCADMPNYLLIYGDEELDNVITQHYRKIEAALNRLHSLNFAAVEMLVNNFTDLDPYKFLKNWNTN